MVTISFEDVPDELAEKVKQVVGEIVAKYIELKVCSATDEQVEEAKKQATSFNSKNKITPMVLGQ